ncbi:YdhK family protein [Bacillus manliponensis]|uniref:YdhK family protein n=1 Tax=Bacillus manliponensis TaxID=574376 RepID=UPI003518C74A
MFKKQVFVSFMAAFVLVLGACTNTNDADKESKKDNTQNEETDHSNMDHSNMDHSSSGEVPKGLKEVENPTYKVGSKAVMETDHMSGMKGAEAIIVGAYETTVYAISYDQTTDGKRVENHKWVVHEELKDAGEAPLKSGDEVVVKADHMKGMDGAKATIDSAEQTTVYMVDFIPTTGGEEVKNHKWVTEEELSPIK